MDKLLLTGLNLSRYFNSRRCRMYDMNLQPVRPNLELKTRPRKLLSFFPARYRVPRPQRGKGRHETRHNDTQHNDIKHNDTSLMTFSKNVYKTSHSA